MSDLLRIQNLEKHYDGFDLEGVSLAVPAGSVVGFIGSNGAGKTTTIKAILGLIKPDGGTISLFGEEVSGAPEKRLAELKQRIGVVFDTCSFPEELTVNTVGKLMKQCYKGWNPGAFRTFVQQLGLPADKTVKDLSRGMGMKLSLACALAHDPDLLILDEATAGLDPMAREEALDTLRLFMGEHRGILMSSHITSDLEKIADYIAFIHKGKLVFSKSKDDILYGFGIAKCGEEAFTALDKTDVLAYRKNKFGYEVLVDDAPLARAKYDGMCIDKPTIEEIMTLYVRGARQEQ